MVTLEIAHSVGIGGANSKLDVIVVQSLLNRHMSSASRHLAVDGDVGVHTRAAIISYQHRIGMRHPDGLVEPVGPTWNALTDGYNLHTIHLHYEDLLTDAFRWFEHNALDLVAVPTTSARKITFFDWDKAPHSDRGGRTGTQVQATAQPGHLCWGAKVSPSFKAKVIEVSRALELNPDYLMACMAFESGESFSPKKTNTAGSGATGLIQFMPRTAKGLGTTTEKLAAMTPEQQLDYVEQYLKSYKGKMHSLEDVYMAILYPADIGKPVSTGVFSDPSVAYSQNKGLDTDKDGKVSIGEISAKIRSEYEKGLRQGNYG